MLHLCNLKFQSYKYIFIFLAFSYYQFLLRKNFKTGLLNYTMKIFLKAIM